MLCSMFTHSAVKALENKALFTLKWILQGKKKKKKSGGQWPLLCKESCEYFLMPSKLPILSVLEITSKIPTEDYWVGAQVHQNCNILVETIFQHKIVMFHNKSSLPIKIADSCGVASYSIFPGAAFHTQTRHWQSLAHPPLPIWGNIQRAPLLTCASWLSWMK